MISKALPVVVAAVAVTDFVSAVAFVAAAAAAAEAAFETAAVWMGVWELRRE